MGDAEQEARKFIAEQHKLIREADKEIKRLRDWPWLVALCLIGGLIAF